MSTFPRSCCVFLLALSCSPEGDIVRSNLIKIQPGKAATVLEEVVQAEGSYSLSIFPYKTDLNIQASPGPGINKSVLQALIQVRAQRTTKAFYVDVGTGITLGLSGDSFSVQVLNGGITPDAIDVGATLAVGINPDSVQSATYTLQLAGIPAGAFATRDIPPFARSVTVTRSTPIPGPYSSGAVAITTFGNSGQSGQTYAFAVSNDGPITLSPYDATIQVTNTDAVSLNINLVFEIRI